MAEVEFDWVNLREPWERLRWARERHAKITQEAAGKAIDLSGNAYGHHERPPSISRNTALTEKKAMSLGARLGVRWRWLVYGEGDPWVTPAEEAHDIIAAQPPEDQRRILASVRAYTGTDG